MKQEKYYGIPYYHCMFSVHRTCGIDDARSHTGMVGQKIQCSLPGGFPINYLTAATDLVGISPLILFSTL